MKESNPMMPDMIHSQIKNEFEKQFQVQTSKVIYQSNAQKVDDSELRPTECKVKENEDFGEFIKSYIKSPLTGRPNAIYICKRCPQRKFTNPDHIKTHVQKHIYEDAHFELPLMKSEA